MSRVNGCGPRDLSLFKTTSIECRILTGTYELKKLLNLRVHRLEHLLHNLIRYVNRERPLDGDSFENAEPPEWWPQDHVFAAIDSMRTKRTDTSWINVLRRLVSTGYEFYKKSPVELVEWTSTGGNISRKRKRVDVKLKKVNDEVKVRKVDDKSEIKKIGEKLNNHGKMKVKNFDGKVKLKSFDGNVKLKNIDGKVKLDFIDGKLKVRKVDHKMKLGRVDGCAVELNIVNGKVKLKKVKGDNWKIVGDDMMNRTIVGDAEQNGEMKFENVRKIGDDEVHIYDRTKPKKVIEGKKFEDEVWLKSFDDDVRQKQIVKLEDDFKKFQHTKIEDEMKLKDTNEFERKKMKLKYVNDEFQQKKVEGKFKLRKFDLADNVQLKNATDEFEQKKVKLMNCNTEFEPKKIKEIKGKVKWLRSDLKTDANSEFGQSKVQDKIKLKDFGGRVKLRRFNVSLKDAYNEFEEKKVDDKVKLSDNGGRLKLRRYYRADNVSLKDGFSEFEEKKVRDCVKLKDASSGFEEKVGLKNVDGKIQLRLYDRTTKMHVCERNVNIGEDVGKIEDVVKIEDEVGERVERRNVDDSDLQFTLTAPIEATSSTEDKETNTDQMNFLSLMHLNLKSKDFPEQTETTVTIGMNKYNSAIPFSSDLGRLLIQRDRYVLSKEMYSRKTEKMEYYLGQQPVITKDKKFEVSYNKNHNCDHLYTFPRRQFLRKSRKFSRRCFVRLERIDVGKSLEANGLTCAYL